MTPGNPDAFDGAMARRWHLYRPPARPSAGDVAIYEAALIPSEETLLLGSTPEIRSLGRRLAKRIVAVDKNDQVFRGLESLVTGPSVGESFVARDWLDMDLGRRFDLIVGDGAINMLPPHLHEGLIQQLAEHARPGGRVLLRAYVVSVPSLENPEAVLERARELSCDLYTAVKIHLSQLWLDRQSGAMPNSVFWRQLKQLHRDGLLTDGELDTLGTVLADDTLTVYFVHRERLEQQIAPWFDLLDVRSPGDYEASDQKPIFVLGRR